MGDRPEGRRRERCFRPDPVVRPEDRAADFEGPAPSGW